MTGAPLDLDAIMRELAEAGDAEDPRHGDLVAALARAREEASAWRALALARSNRGIPMLDPGLEIRRRQLAGDAALNRLRALGIDPDAQVGS